MFKTGIKLDVLILLALLSVIGLFVLSYGQNQTKAPVFSLESGLYVDSAVLEITAGLGAKIYYTTDGSEPTRDDILYTEPIVLTDASSQENRISSRSDLSVEKYIVPTKKIDKSNIIKAKAYYSPNDEGSKVVVGNYLIKSKNELDKFSSTDIMFISANLDDLVDYEKGMMIKGAYFDGFLREKEMTELEFSDLDYDDCDVKANFSRVVSERYEKKVDVEYLRGDAVIFDDSYTIRNRGVSSSNGPKKTYNLYYRENLSKDFFDKDIFECNIPLDKLILRREDCLLHDALYEKLFSGSDMVLPDAGIPVQIFINGEYWGLYCLEEKMDENWFSTHLGVPGDKVTVLKNNSVTFGNTYVDQEMEELIDFCALHDLTDEKNYAYFCDKVDIDSFLLYYATMFYIDACDFNETYNTMQWRVEGGKWHWSLYDLDNSANNASQDTLNEELKPGKDNAIGKHTMFKSVMRNPKAQELFKEKLSELKYILSGERVTEILEDQRLQLVVSGNNDNNRWGARTDWESEISETEVFFENREKYVDNYVDVYLDSIN